MVTLKDCCSILTDGDWIETKDQSDTGIRLVQTGNIGNGEFIEKESRAKYISEDKFNELGCTEIFPGDILVSRLPDPVGRACKIPRKTERMITAVDCSILRIDESVINSDYLLFFLQSPSYFFQLTSKLAGSTRIRISRKNLEKVALNIPTKNDQNNIVNTLSCIKAIIQLRKKQINDYDTLIKSRFVEMFGDPVENPKGYKVATLQSLIDAGDITYHLDGNHGGDYPKNEEFVSEGVPYIGANCILNGQIDFSLAKHLTEERAGKLRKGIAQDEDVLFAHNATVGPTVVLHTTESKVILSTSLTAYRCNKESIMPEYLATYMKSDGFVMQYSNEMKQTTRNQVPITAQKKYLFLIPPMEEQKAFSGLVKQIEKSKATVQQSLNESQLLFDSLMQKYFG